MNIWQTRSLITWLLAPLSLLFGLLIFIRRWLYQVKILQSYRSPVPVLVVGNISVGGNGKTPVVIWIVEQLQQRGIKVGVISRGYGGKNKVFPQLVTADSLPELMGDEPVLIAQRTRAPVAISPNRQQSITLLLKQFELDFIVTDDGLQHYALQRDMEWIVVDGVRLFGNGFLLPAGGLRELPSRLNHAQAVIYNNNRYARKGFSMSLKGEYALNLITDERRHLSEFKTEDWVAMAGIGDPSRFFVSLAHYLVSESEQSNPANEKEWCNARYHSFADHQAYTPEMLSPLANLEQPLLMTEKDAVKCRAFAQHNWWYVPVEAQFMEPKEAEQLLTPVLQLIEKYNERKTT